MIIGERKRIDMKVLITTDWFSSAVNGVVSSLLALEKGLKERGHEVRILTLSENGESYIDGNVYFQASHSCSFIYAKARYSVRLDRSILSDIVSWHPDVIHSQCEFSTFRMAKKIAGKCSCPIVHTFHTDYERYVRYCHIPDSLSKMISGMLFRYASSGSSLLIAPSKKTAAQAEGYAIGKTCFIIPSAIDTERFYGCTDSSVREKYGIKEDVRLLLFLGRVAEEKNIDELLRFSSSLLGSNVKFMIAGDGPAMMEVRELVSSLGIEDHVIFTGMVNPSDVPKYYHAADVFLSASTSETQGLCVYEALSSSLPVICRKDPAMDGVIEDGFDGYQYEDESGFRKALADVLHDSGKLDRMRMNCRNLSLRFSIPVFAERAEKAYKTALRGQDGIKGMVHAL